MRIHKVHLIKLESMLDSFNSDAEAAPAPIKKKEPMFPDAPSNKDTGFAEIVSSECYAEPKLKKEKTVVISLNLTHIIHEDNPLFNVTDITPDGYAALARTDCATVQEAFDLLDRLSPDDISIGSVKVFERNDEAGDAE